MSVITKISPQKNKKRVNVHLNGKFSFGLGLETFIKSKIKVEDTLSQEEIDELIKQSELIENFEKIVNFTTLRPRSEFEIKRWCTKKKLSDATQEELNKKLKKLELMGDTSFAKWWVNQRLQFKNRSKRELENELRSKGVKKDIIMSVLSSVNLDEEKSAIKLLLKNDHRWKRFDGRQRKLKMQQYLSRKGFNWGDIKKAINEVESGH